MKRITAMLMAMAFAAVSLTGRSNSSTSSDNVSGISSEQESFVTTSSTTVPEDTSSETEKEIVYKTSPNIETLLVGVLNAIGSHNEEEYNTYISEKNRTHQWYSYKAVHKQFQNALYNAGFDHNATYTYKDFTVICFTGGGVKDYYLYFTENPDKIMFYTSNAIYRFDIDTEEYFLAGIRFGNQTQLGNFEKEYDKATDPDYVYSEEYPEYGYSIVDLSEYAQEVSE